MYDIFNYPNIFLKQLRIGALMPKLFPLVKEWPYRFRKNPSVIKKIIRRIGEKETNGNRTLI